MPGINQLIMQISKCQTISILYMLNCLEMHVQVIDIHLIDELTWGRFLSLARSKLQCLKLRVAQSPLAT